MNVCGLTWKQASDLLGCSTAAMAQWKTGKTGPSKKTIFRLEKAELDAGIEQKKTEIQLSCVSKEIGEYMTDTKRAELRKELNGVKAELVDLCTRVNRIVDELG